MTATPPINVVVIGGYLGSGKTTLVNHILREGTELRTMVLVNDFGNLAIDEEFVASRDGALITMTNGCVCCGLTGTLSDTMREIREMHTPPELLVIEASGVADPRSIAHHAMVPGFRLDGVVVVVDAAHVRSRARHSLVGRSVQRQLAAADLLVVNKLDLLDDLEGQQLINWLHTTSPQASLIPAIQCHVPVSIVVGAGSAGGGDETPSVDSEHVTHDVWSWTGGPLRAESFRAWLEGLPDDLVRVKGTVTLVGAGRVLVQRVGLRTTLTALPDSDANGRLVVLGLPGSVHPAALSEGLGGAAVVPR